MNTPEEIPEHIFDLMSEKTFDELSSLEKEAVLKYMTEHDYRENSIMIEDFQTVDANLQFDAVSPVKNNEKSAEPSKGRFAFSYLQIAATVIILISLGMGFGQFFNQSSDVLPIVAEEETSNIKVSAPVYVNVTPVNVQAMEMEVQKIKQVASQVNEEKGSSLEEDNYPEEFVIRI
jgi:hypothetical protein